MATGSKTQPDDHHIADRIAEEVAGPLNQQGLSVLMGRLTASQLALARRHDPLMRPSHPYGLTPGWESLSLGGKPGLDAVISGLRAQQLNAADRDVEGAWQLVAPFDLRPSTDLDRQRALRCLTQAIYYEAALEPTGGQEGVAQVVLNRVRDSNYPTTICGVVYQGAERTTGCQFSFTCDGSLARSPTPWAWNRALMVAEKALKGHVAGKVGTATHYHADYVRPWWAPTLDRITQIGAHIFYRWRGPAGDSSSLIQASSGREPFIDEDLYAQPRLVQPIESPTDQAGEDTQVLGLLTPGNREVEYQGQTRIVGAPSLGGRRQASREEIDAINMRLKAYAQGQAMSEPVTDDP